MATHRSRTSIWTPILAFALIIFIVGTYFAYQRGYLNFGDKTTNTKNQSRRIEVPPGLVAVPIAPRDIAPLTKVRRDHLWDAQSQGFKYVFLAPENVSEHVLTKISEIRGRVLKHPKRRGFVFTKDDFHPAGTREGLVAAIPPGYRSMRVSTNQLKGLHELRAGDRFDVVSAQPVDAKARDLEGMDLGAGVGSMIRLEATMKGSFAQANVRVVVREGIVITPVHLRAQPSKVGTTIRGTSTRTIPVQEMVIAIRPGEVVALAEVFATDCVAWCAPRSGRPGGAEIEMQDHEAQSPLTQALGGTDDVNSLALIERISGSERTRVLVPTPGASLKPHGSNGFGNKDQGERIASSSQEKNSK